MDRGSSRERILYSRDMDTKREMSALVIKVWSTLLYHQ